jgi:hypothetical protein
VPYRGPACDIVRSPLSLVAAIDRHLQDGDAGTRDDALALTLLAHAAPTTDGHLLVIGAGHGHNALALGAAARATNAGRVFAVDIYPEKDDSDNDGWSLDGLVGRVAAQGLSSWVLPHYGTAATFAHLMPADFRCRLVHIEGAHACSHVDTDLYLLERLLAPGGWLTVGPGFTGFPGAREALHVFLRLRPDIGSWQWLTPGLQAGRKLE